MEDDENIEKNLLVCKILSKQSQENSRKNYRYTLYINYMVKNDNAVSIWHVSMFGKDVTGSLMYSLYFIVTAKFDQCKQTPVSRNKLSKFESEFELKFWH